MRRCRPAPRYPGCWESDALYIFLVTQRDLASFTHTPRARGWSSAQAQAHLIPRACPDRQPPLFIAPLLRSIHRAPPFCLCTTPYRSPPLVDADDEASASPPTPLPATPTCTRSHHAMSIPHASAIAAPADSGHLHAYRRQSAPESYHFPRPSAYCGHSVPKSYTHCRCSVPNITVFQGPAHLVILLAPSLPLVGASVTISTPINPGFGMS